MNKKEIQAFLFAGLPLLGFLIFSLIPLVSSLAMAFFDIRGLEIAGSEFVWFENFAYVLTDPDFWHSLSVTAYAACSLPVSLLIALVIATLLHQKLKGTTAFKVIFFIPYVCSTVATAFMWKMLFDCNHGVINDLLLRLNLIEYQVNWLGEEDTFMPTMLVIQLWGSTAYGILMFGAALNNVDKSLYEAAQVDGAGWFKKFIHITLPGISPTTFYLITVGLINACQAFALFQVMCDSVSSGMKFGPGNMGMTTVFYIYSKGIQSLQLGVASVAAWFLSMIMIVLTMLNFKFGGKWVNYD